MLQALSALNFNGSRGGSANLGPDQAEKMHNQFGRLDNTAPGQWHICLTLLV